jgi:hypothetical protein
MQHPVASCSNIAVSLPSEVISKICDSDGHCNSGEKIAIYSSDKFNEITECPLVWE